MMSKEANKRLKRDTQHVERDIPFFFFLEGGVLMLAPLYVFTLLPHEWCGENGQQSSWE